MDHALLECTPYLHCLIHWTGIVVASFLLVFAVLLVAYALFREKAEPFLDSSEMPKLRPIPIATKNRNIFMRILVWMFDIRQWELIDDWRFQWRDACILIPKDFVFDGASIPRPLWGVLSPVGLLLIPGLIHDYGYKHQQLWQETYTNQRKPYMEGANRAEWDRLFKEIGEEVNGFAVIDYLAWLALRLFGWLPWRQHRKNESAAK